MPLTPMARPNGPRVRELRQDAGWSQVELARRIRRTHGIISRIERSAPVSGALMLQVARAFRIDLGEITLPDEQQERPPGEPDEVAA
jgi:transcriptional regulator with XRE-family HTH domain